MGRDWYWGSGAKTSKTKRASERVVNGGQSTPSGSGCIAAIFHLFDFHRFQFPLNHHQTSSSGCTNCFKPDSFLSQDPSTIVKGAEAPRNSLESEEEDSCSVSVSASASASVSASASASSKEEEILNIPMGIQIKTRAGNNDSSSEISSSPGPKTPTLVARLMGLDLLPENRSPSLSSATPNFHSNYTPKQPLQSGHRKSLDGEIRGTRSMPETPRISSARRSDVDHHHRLSLQINKENVSPSPSEELVISRISSWKRKELKNEFDENRSAAHFARQIVKESVGRKVGLDITNTVRNRDQAREELANQFKYKKISRAKVGEDSSPGKHTAQSCSPRLRFLESKTKPSTSDYNSQNPKPEINLPIKILPKPKLQEQNEHHHRARSVAGKGFGSSRLKRPQQTSDVIRNKQEESFVRPSTASRVNIPDKKCRKTPLSNDILYTTVPTLVPVKRDRSHQPTKIPQKQIAQRPNRSSQLSSCSSLTYNKRETTQVNNARDNNIGDGHRCNVATTTPGDEEEYEYIASILRRTGLNKDTPVPVSFTSWFSPSHPLDPSIFDYLEHLTNYSPTNNNNKHKLSHLCNRKLLFYLVDEILIDILKPYFNLKPWVNFTIGHEFSSGHMCGSQLMHILRSKIKSFPQADCRVLEDIDALIDKDLPEMKVQSEVAYEEEGEGIVTEIEKDILDSLVHETALDFRVKPF